MEPIEQYYADMEKRVASYRTNADLQTAKWNFFDQIGIGKANYVYNFTWLGIPIIQLPQDLQAMQEIIWQVKPDLVVETGIAWGGSLLFTASMLAILEACDEIEKGQVVGVDIDIRSHNRKSIQSHPLARKIHLIEGSSIEDAIVDQVRSFAHQHNRVLVCLDSNHAHDHVLAELEAYAPMVSVGSYCIVEDTIIEDAPEGMVSERPWGKGNSPKTAVWEYLDRISTGERLGLDGKALAFEIDRVIEDKILLTGSPDGYLRRLETN
uniref:Cephalosporin hydroxylase n=1 Tax=Candidatus Kentrum sp. MB TaxID=2138164 RepID=A0A450X1Z1_9GAMM|nr:MAG: Cephalosporin hydroxylase [Candidatus Kentron sp. MB]VFK28449.1 MAG: Cephalosporin hydroxylase [Candidatus Kentron sp. MB]VFK74258.1 MAG: Cephalosporin hydroxylase [Candidatus Kentron sp. MB]